MQWNTATRYKILLEINNAVVNQTCRESLFKALASELRNHFYYDRMCINLYDDKANSLSYFAAADGIEPGGILSKKSRPLAYGTIARMVVQSRQPAIIDDLSHYSDLSSVGAMIEAGLNATMAFPLIIRNRVLGSIHFSFKKAPEFISELTEVLADASKQVAIAVDNMLTYTRLKELNASLQRQNQYLRASSDEYKQEEFFYASPAMAAIMSLVEKAADSDAAVLITGETGTGKDYLARYIHQMSPRREQLFIKINCPALVSTLFESELFGYAKGAFTGAEQKRIGRLELAHGGTVFLDEIAELPIAMQAKLLHVLQDKKFERVGDHRPLDVDFRVIAASNKNLEEEIHKGSFRQDLYYRLNILDVRVPPLRGRIEDIALLVEKLTQIQAKKTNRSEPIYTEEAIRKLSKYTWPGNVRELKNLVKQMIILRPGEKITSSDIVKLLDRTATGIRGHSDKMTTLADVQRQHIVQALIKSRGVIGGAKGAARMLGLPRSTLQYRMKTLGLEPNDYQKEMHH
ncbi:MAG: sigma 54-interacting transcriptional regulator [Desulfobacterales bacterium]|jgi:transcriptional regulator with GAF, ATPase, and Fis domain